ncbi:MAG: hypothetical protein RIR26_2982 [Pseudomonadota bacterium]|jgi:chromosome segregation ATPase
MESALVYASLGFGGLASVATLFLFISRSRLQEHIQSLQNKLTMEQARASAVQVRNTAPRPKPETKPAAETNKHTAELLELRKSNGHLKDEVKQLKATLRQSEQQLKDFDSRAEGLHFKILAENKALLERLKDLDQNSPDKKRAAALEQELGDLRLRLKETSLELQTTSSKLKSEKNFSDKQKLQLETLQSEVRSLKSRLPETTESLPPPADQKTLDRWKDRALTARHMYKMMRQMRELSDLKLSTYQEAVVDVSQSLLSMKGIPTPELAPNENRADRLLAEAWALVHPEVSSNA